MNDDVSCREIVEVVTDYLEGALSRQDRVRFERHLLTCAGCDVYLEQMREVIRATGALGEQDVPEELMDALVSSFRSWRP
jgi:anti-sigma factor RsiW